MVFIPKRTGFELPFLCCGGHITRKQMYVFSRLRLCDAKRALPSSARGHSSGSYILSTRDFPRWVSQRKVLKGFWPYNKSFILTKFIRSRWLHFSHRLVALPYSLRSRRLEVVSRSVSLGSSFPFFLVPTTLLLYPGNGSK